MEDVLLGILKLSLYACLSYIVGIAARIWWEIKFLLICIFGPIFLGLLSFSVFFDKYLAIGQNIQDIMSCAMIFIPLGYITGYSIYERFMVSDALDETYRKYAKRNKKTYTAEEIDAFNDHFRTHKTGSNTSYEQYSQHRRSQARSNTHAPPHQDYRSDKDRMLDILEVADKNASAKDLKSAYRTLARKHHPDILASNGLSEEKLKAAEQRMQEINQAYDWLEDNGFA